MYIVVGILFNKFYSDKRVTDKILKESLILQLETNRMCRTKTKFYDKSQYFNFKLENNVRVVKYSLHSRERFA
jgi:hypothetical protein